MAFIGVALAFISAFLLAYCGVFVCLLLSVALPHRPILAIYVCAFTCAWSFTVCSGWGVFSFLGSFLVFFLPPSSPFISLWLLLCITLVFFFLA